MSGSLRIEVNGKPRTVEAGQTVRDLLDGLGIDARLVVVEVNRQIVRSTEHDALQLAEGDRLEVVNFVGGG